MTTDLTPLHAVQVAYATTDVRAAARRFHELTGAGPFFVWERVAAGAVQVDGLPGVFDHSCALGQWGEMMVEFVHHHELGPERLDRDMRRGGQGIHHVATVVDELESARDRLLDNGCRLVVDVVNPAVRYIFLDPGPEVGHLIELYERTPFIENLYRRVKEASLGWDGREVLR